MTARRQPANPTTRRRRTRTARDYKGIVGYVLTAVLVGLVVYFALVSPTFYVKHTIVTGVKTVPADSIVSVMDLSPTQNVFLIHKRRIAARLLQNPVLREVTIYRRLPGTVSVRATEREADLVLQSKGVLYDVDRDGVPFRKPGKANPNVPLVTCDLRERVVLGRRLRDDSFLNARSALMLSRQYSELVVAMVTVDPSTELCLNTRDGFPIRLGRADQLPRKVEIAANMVRQIPDLLERGEYADISCPEAPAYKIKQ